MFHRAALKLTAWYLTIVMSLSLVFSVAVYQLATRELNRSFRPQGVIIQLLRERRIVDLEEVIESQLVQGRARVQRQLAWLNLAVLVVGGLASYALARRTLRPIEAALAAQRQFTADASHELRTPLAAMQTELEVALRGGSLPARRARAVLTSNLEEVIKLATISEHLLGLARAEDRQIARGRVSLANVVREASERVARLAKARQCRVVGTVADLLVWGDQPSLIQLVTILLDNALKYSRRGGTVTVLARRERDRVILAVADRGQGIRAVDLPHIFDRFYRADQSRTKSAIGGYGLGLAIAKALVAAHRGTINATSTPGRGSTFTLSLPRA